MIGEENGVVTFEDIRNNAEIRTYIEKGNENLGVLGFTKHSVGHATKVSDTAAKILEELDYDVRTVELARIAGYMHDIGNCVNRTDHAHSGAIMAMLPNDLVDEYVAYIEKAMGEGSAYRMSIRPYGAICVNQML